MLAFASIIIILRFLILNFSYSHPQVLDIAGPAPLPGRQVPLLLRSPDPRRQLTQTWHFAGNGRLSCQHRGLCVQAKEGFLQAGQFWFKPGNVNFFVCGAIFMKLGKFTQSKILNHFYSRIFFSLGHCLSKNRMSPVGDTGHKCNYSHYIKICHSSLIYTSSYTYKYECTLTRNVYTKP